MSPLLPYGGNVRYTLQRWTGVIAFVFILWHVFHMHGWIRADWWIEGVASPFRRATVRSQERLLRRRGASKRRGLSSRCTPWAFSCRCTTWPTASGRWASPGACGPARTRSGGPRFPAWRFGLLLGSWVLGSLYGMVDGRTAGGSDPAKPPMFSRRLGVESFRITEPFRPACRRNPSELTRTSNSWQNIG